MDYWVAPSASIKRPKALLASPVNFNVEYKLVYFNLVNIKLMDRPAWLTKISFLNRSMSNVYHLQTN